MRNSEIDAVVRQLTLSSRRWKVPATEAVGIQTRDPFRVLISCILSLRTQDTVTGPATQRLFSRAKTPRTLLRLPEAVIRKLIYPAGFYRTKAKNIHRICRQLIERFEGKVPSAMSALLILPGVGRKTANLVLTVGFKKPGICVDTHVHRISNRLGYVRTATPLETEMALRRKLPRKHWMKINLLLVSLGQAICHPISPWCSRCPIGPRCSRRGVVRSR